MTVQEIKRRIEKANGVGLRQLKDKGRELAENATTMRIMEEIGNIEDGYKREFWDNYQRKGNRTDYRCAFAGSGWNSEILTPKYDIVPGNAYLIFAYSDIEGDLAAILKKSGVVMDFSLSTNNRYAFYKSSKITHIGKVDSRKCSSKNSEYLFTGCTQLVSIDEYAVTSVMTYTETFLGCTALENIRMSGEIGQSLSFGDSPLLSAESVKSIIECLVETQSTSTVTFNSQVVLSDEQKAEISEKGWTLVQ